MPTPAPTNTATGSPESPTLSAALDVSQLQRFAGVFRDGYTDDDINRVFGLIRRLTGIEFVVLWDGYIDERTRGYFDGSSEFTVRVERSLYTFGSAGDGEPDLFAFLTGECSALPAQLVIELHDKVQSAVDSGHNSAVQIC